MDKPVKYIQAISKQEMTREEFIKFTGASFLGIIGIWGILQNVQSLQQRVVKGDKRGYGMSPYGR